MSVIDWSKYDEPWCTIGPAFRREVEQIVGAKAAAWTQRTPSRPPVDMGRGRVPAMAGEDRPVDAPSGRNPTPEPAKRLPKIKSPKRSLRPQKRRRTARQPERRKSVVPPDDATAIAEFLKHRGATVLPPAYAETTQAAKA